MALTRAASVRPVVALALMAGCTLGWGCGMTPGDDAVASSAGDVTVPDGFAIDVFASGLGEVRTLEFGPDGALYAALSGDGRVVRIDPASADRKPATVADGLNRPYGLAFHDGALFVGEHDQVTRLDGPDARPGLPLQRDRADGQRAGVGARFRARAGAQ